MNSQVLVHSLAYLTKAAGMTLYVLARWHRSGHGNRLSRLPRACSGSPPLARLGAVYVSFFRGVPLLVQLLFIYYFLAEFGVDVPAMVAAIGGLGLASGAYQAETLRGALNAVPPARPKRQSPLDSRASRSGGASFCRRRFRISVPPLINEFTLLLKASSLVSVVGIAELTRVSMNIASSTYRPLEA